MRTRSVLPYLVASAVIFVTGLVLGAGKSSDDPSVANTASKICLAVGLTSVGSFITSFRRVYGVAPLAYRATFPPASRHIRIPDCVARAYGRPQNRTFREAGSLARP